MTQNTDIKALQQDYRSMLPLYDRLKDEVSFILNNKLDSTPVKYTLTSRTKTWKSFADKAQRKQLEKPFEEINDVVGLRIVCLFLSDIDTVSNMLRSSFEIVAEDNKINGYEASSFGYMSVHFIAKLGEDCSGPRYDDLKGRLFEIQLRTIAMDAWANISHYLDYKSEDDIPSDLKKDFYAISGLFYVADKHFEVFFRASEQSRKSANRDAEKENNINTREINLDTLSAYLEKRLPDRVRSNSKDISELIVELKTAGYKRISEIDYALNIAWDAFLKYENDYPPNSEPGTKYYDIGVIRGVFDLIDHNFREDKVSSRSKHQYAPYRKYIEHIKSHENTVVN